MIKHTRLLVYVSVEAEKNRPYYLKSKGKDNGHSKIRNKGIANIFSQMGLVEAWGSGIKRILNAAEEYGLPKPRFQKFDNMFRVELFRN